MQRFLLLSGVLSCVVLYVLTVSTDSESMWAEYFWLVVGAGALLISGMFAVILRFIWQTVRDKRNQVFGSRMARRLSLMFTLVAVLPASFLFAVSAQFISNTIDSWFGNDTREALERSLDLSKSALDLAVESSMRKGVLLRNELQALPDDAFERSNSGRALAAVRADQFAHAALWTWNDAPELAQERNLYHFRAPEIDEETVAAVRQSGAVRSVESIDGELYAQGWLALPERGGQPLVLFFRDRIPKKVAEDAELIESARAKYAELMYAQRGLQTFFLVTLMVAALLAILLALAAALYFARRFSEPILLLADGARKVAQGDFEHTVPVTASDELGQLTELFNHMTRELSVAKHANEQHRSELEAERHFLERVLESLSAGVLTLDAEGKLNTYNGSAEQILAMPLAELIGQGWGEWAALSPQHAVLSETIGLILDTEHEGSAVEISYAGPDDSRILLGKAVRLPAENGKGIVVVFDNITALVHAQKEAAWGEVAKRLAHEIRNPLTPIQLSAERLAWKLLDKLDEADAQILNKSTGTIIKQVAALKEMVEAFRNYARAPALKLGELDLNTLVEEVLVLYESTPCAFHADLAEGGLPIRADTTAMRQVLHNLLKNAAEAAEDDDAPQVWVGSRRNSAGAVELKVANNGKSFSKTMLQNAFEPYKTDKPTGTGLGLPVVKKIIEEHGGSVALANRHEGGATVRIILPPFE